MSAALLDWSRPADELWALAPQSSGGRVNRPALPKVWLGEALAAVLSLQVGTMRSAATPGTVVSILPQSLGVATTSHDIALKDFMTLDGRALTVPELVRIARLHEGLVLPAFPRASERAALAHACDRQQEAAWMAHWRRIRPVVSPLRLAAGVAPRGRSMLLKVRPGQLRQIFDGGDFVLAVLLAWLARSAAAEAFDIGLRCAATDASPPGANVLLARTRPFRVDADFSLPFERFLRTCSSRLAAWRMRKPYFRDAVMRHPQLARPQGWADFDAWPVVVELTVAGSEGCGAAVTRSGPRFTVHAQAGEVTLVHDGMTAPQLGTIASQLERLAQDALVRPWAPLGSLALLSPEEVAQVRDRLWDSPVSPISH